MEKDQEFVLTVVKYLVENPDDVQVDRKVDEMGVLLTLKVNAADMGKIIGKEGRTAKSIRTLLRVLGARMDARVNLKIEEPEGSTYVPPSDDSSNASDDVASDDAASATPATNSTPSASSSDTSADFDPLSTGSEFLKGQDDASAIPDQPATESKDENPTSIL